MRFWFFGWLRTRLRIAQLSAGTRGQRARVEEEEIRELRKFDDTSNCSFRKNPNCAQGEQKGRKQYIIYTTVYRKRSAEHDLLV
jgi:hypothetical protein